MIELLHFDNLSQYNGLIGYITTRQGGVSREEYASLNLSMNSGDNPENTIVNRNRLAHHLGISQDQLIFANQIHGNRIRIIDETYLNAGIEEQKQQLEGIDALVTNQPGIAIHVLTADCVPILLYCPTKQVIAAIHAGWRGVACRLVSDVVALMTDQFMCDPQSLIAAIGPAISAERFEVGSEVEEQFTQVGLLPDTIGYVNTITDKRHFDLQDANKQLLLHCGLSSEHIELKQLCTYNNDKLFFSARRQGIHSGRQAAGILLI